MQAFQDIYNRAIQRKGAEILSARLIEPKAPSELRSIPDDRWLAEMTKCIFQAGFNWKIIEDKWPAFEEAFFGFDLFPCQMMSDDDIDSLMSQKKIVANFVKINTVRQNARYLLDLADDYGSVGAFFADWKPEEYCNNVLEMRQKGARLGGNTGLIFLRRMGVDAFIFSDDVVRALDQAKVINKAPTSKKAMNEVQETLNKWREETGFSLNHLSQIAACSL